MRRNGEVFDKVALMRAAEYGGHHRPSVVVKHYLWNRSHPASGSASGIRHNVEHVAHPGDGTTWTQSAPEGPAL